MSDTALLRMNYKTEKTEYQIHYHDHHELLLITEGVCEMLIDGKPYLAQKGDVILIGNLENHSTRILEQPYHRYVLNIHPVLFQSIIGDNRLLAMFKHHGKEFQHCLSMEQTDVMSLMQKLYVEMKQTDAFSDSMQLCYLKAILISIFRAHSDCFSNTLDQTAETILAAEGYLDAHFQEDIKIEALADQFFLNKYYFTHSFKEVTGFSPKQYLTMVRLNHAIHLLGHTELTVTQVSIQSGFVDISNFIRLFKANFGVTPGEWKHQRK